MPTSGGPGAITRQATKSSTVSEFLSNAYTALELAIKLAPLIPVPFMSSMLASAQVIVDAANVCLPYFAQLRTPLHSLTQC
jgi:hypothetical protein